MLIFCPLESVTFSSIATFCGLSASLFGQVSLAISGMLQAFLATRRIILISRSSFSGHPWRVFLEVQQVSGGIWSKFLKWNSPGDLKFDY